jgi:hypothetical protein
MADLAKEITEYLRGERRSVRDSELVRLVVQDSIWNPQWTKTTAEQWEAAIDEAVKRGLIVREGSVLSLPKVVARPKVEQLDLF